MNRRLRGKSLKRRLIAGISETRRGCDVFPGVAHANGCIRHDCANRVGYPPGRP